MLRKILGVLLGIFVLSVIVVGLIVAFNYHADKDLTSLKEKYSLLGSNFIEVKGMPVHYVIEGNGKKNFLLLHGTGSSLHTWDAWVDIMKDHFRIIRLDLPGFGLTGPNPKERYDRIFYTLFLESFIQKIGLDDFHMAGNSFGGYLAWNYALKNPYNVDKLILLNASGYPREGYKMPLGFKLAKNETIGPLMEKITPKRIVSKTVYDAYEDDGKVTDETLDRYFDLLLREGNRKAMMLKMQHIAYDNWRDIGKVKNPTLILWGSEDAVVPASHAYKFHKDIKHSEFIMYEDIGHLPMEEIPKQSALDVLEFLNINMASIE